MQVGAAGKLVQSKHRRHSVRGLGNPLAARLHYNRWLQTSHEQVLLHNSTGNICKASAKLAHLDARHGILLAYNVTQNPLQSHSAPSVVNIKGLQVFSSSQCPVKSAFSCGHSHPAAFVSCVLLNGPSLYSLTVGPTTLNIPRKYLQTVTSPEHIREATRHASILLHIKNGAMLVHEPPLSLVTCMA